MSAGVRLSAREVGLLLAWLRVLEAGTAAGGRGDTCPQSYYPAGGRALELDDLLVRLARAYGRAPDVRLLHKIDDGPAEDDEEVLPVPLEAYYGR